MTGAAAGQRAGEPLGVYIHWPFCKSKCPYCDFNSHVRDGVRHERWRNALITSLQVATLSSILAVTTGTAAALGIQKLGPTGRKIATGLGVFYNMLANDAEGVSYSTARTFRLIEIDKWRSIQKFWIEQFEAPLYAEWLGMAMLAVLMALALFNDVSRLF